MIAYKEIALTILDIIFLTFSVLVISAGIFIFIRNLGII